MKRLYWQSLAAVLMCLVATLFVGCAAPASTEARARTSSDQKHKQVADSLASSRSDRSADSQVDTDSAERTGGRPTLPSKVVAVSDRADATEGPPHEPDTTAGRSAEAASHTGVAPGSGRTVGEGRRPHAPGTDDAQASQTTSGLTGGSPHDECVNCIPVSTGVSYNGSSVGATGSDITSCASRDTADVWHCWTADCTGNATFSLCNSGFDTTVAIYEDCGGDELGCDDNGCVGSNDAQLTIPVTAGKTYYIRVAGVMGATGNYWLNVTCVPMGACCVDGNCIGVMREDACTEHGGTWFPGQDCSTVNCPQPDIGACCAGYICTSGYDCGQPIPVFCNGTFDCACVDTYEGEFACIPTAAPCGQSCPNGSSGCGIGEVCAVNLCCDGPVCMPKCPGSAKARQALAQDGPSAFGNAQEAKTIGEGGAGPCVDTDPQTCRMVGGSYMGMGTNCADIVCPGPPGACCISSDCVSGETQQSCQEQGGLWFEGEDCATFDCPEACCHPNGTCTFSAPEVCLEQGGEPQGPGTTCTGVACPNLYQACCFPDGICRDLLPDECITEGGTPQGQNTNCNLVQCRAMGACCIRNDCTGVMTEDECRENGGVWFEGQDCSTFVCPSIGCGESPFPGCWGDCPFGTVCRPSAVAAVCTCEPAPCEPALGGATCKDVPCTDPNDRCVPRCMNHDPRTGASTVIDCECRGLSECYVQAATPGPADSPCVVPDNASGTITLPPEGCEYLSPDEVHEIIDGLPPGTTIELDAIHKDFICHDQPSSFCSIPLAPRECEGRGGSLGGHGDCFESTLELKVRGTGSLKGFGRSLWVPISCEIHTGPRNPGDPVQTFPTDMFRLEGELFGDPDFCTFKVTGGTDNGLPSPGQTTLTRQGPPGSDFAVDSFFDITYQIEFEGCPGSQLDGYMGTTTATLRMQTGSGAAPPSCVGICPTGMICDETAVANPNGTVDICCNCVPEPPTCEPTADGQGCEQVECPITTDKCLPKVVHQMVSAQPSWEVVECECVPDGACRVAFGPGGDVPVWCEGRCPEGFDCNLIGWDTNGDIINDTFECRCQPIPPEACCLRNGTCVLSDPDTCEQQDGWPQGPGTMCSDVTIACCILTSGECRNVDPLCCDDIGGVPSPIGAPFCMGDLNQNGIDDACEEPGTVEIDIFERTAALVQLVGGPLGAEPVPFILRGSAEAHVFFEGQNEGMADDDDLNGLDEVDTELALLDLTDGVATLTLNPAFPSRGQIEELVNDTPDWLDVDPFAPGDATSFFDVFFQIDVGGLILHNEQALRIQAVIREKPPIARYYHIIPPGGPIELYNEAGEPTGIFLVKAEHYTGDIEIDPFGVSFGQVELIDPSGLSEIVELSGASTAAVFFERNLGEAHDDDGDGFDEVETELIALSLTGNSMMFGPIEVRLHPDLRSTGEIEEMADLTTGVLDLPPFGPEGTSASSFFDVFFDIQAGNFRFFTTRPKRMSTIITHKPPGPGTVYENRERIPLVDENGNDTDYSLGAARHAPQPPIEVDFFERTTALVQLVGGPVGPVPVPFILRGSAEAHVFFEGAKEGMAHDDDMNGLDEVNTELVSLNLTDGAATLTLNPIQPSRGEIEELVNATLGLLDVDPFAPGDATGFFDVFFQIDVGGLILHNEQPLRIESVIDHKPPIARYIHIIPPVGPAPIELYNEQGEPTGIFIVKAEHYTGYTEYDEFLESWGAVELVHPSGEVEVIKLSGETVAAVYFEPAEGQADDDDENGKDEVQTEMVEMDLVGESPLLGPLHVGLNPNLPSTGGIEERFNNTPGTLDLPPFIETGSADSFFDIYFEIQVGDLQLFTEQPKRMGARITHKPPETGNVYENRERIPLLDAKGAPSGYFLGATRHGPRPPIEVDVFPFSLGQLQLSGQLGDEIIDVAGDATVHVFFEGPTEGTADDDDGDGWDEVRTEMKELNLMGDSPVLGPVIVELNPDIPSTGEIEETADVTTGVLDVPPFGPPGTTANSSFDIFFKVTLPDLGLILHTERPKGMSGRISHKPPGPLDWYENLENLELFDENGTPTGIFLGATRHRPRPPVEIDRFDFTSAEFELTTPDGETEVIEVSGPAVVHVFFEGLNEGDANDDDGNNLDDVVTQMKELHLQGMNDPLGPVIVTLNPDIPSMGGIEEKVNNTSGTLDIPPFGAVGKAASSFFDVFFQVSLPDLGLMLHTRDPKQMRGQITHKPPATPDFYEGLEPVELFKEDGTPSGYQLSTMRHRPRPPVEVDRFPFSIGEFELTFPDQSSEIISVAGETTVHVFFEGQQEGDAVDDDGNTREEVRTRMVELDLNGMSDTFGPVHVGLNPAIPSVGQIEEKVNNTPGRLDLPPFEPGAADSFFDIFFRIEIGDLVLVTVDRKRMRGQITHKPPATQDWYEGLESVDLYFENGDPSEYRIGATRHRPRPPVEVDRFDFSIGSLELRLPDGTSKTVDVSGETVVHVYFEGQAEGSANDDGPTAGLDEVRTEMISLDLHGVIPELGGITVNLNPNIPSVGEIEEKVNNTPGTLDIPPFTAQGAASSFFNIFFRIEVAGQVFYTIHPKRMSGQITHKPPGPLDRYEGVQDIRLYDENGEPTDFYLAATRHRPRPPVEVDEFDFSIGALEITAPDGTSEVVQVTGDTTVHVFFEGQDQGDADDDDGNGREEVVTQMVELELHGVSDLFGPITVGLNPDIPSFGGIEEKDNHTPATLDLPPFTAAGAADSFFDIFFRVEVGGRVFYTIHPKRMSAQITHKPPGPRDLYEGLLDVELVDEDGYPTGYRLSATRHRPRPPVEVDRFDFSIGELELLLPDGTPHIVEVSGFTEVHVFFEGQGEGSATDDDGNNREEVLTKMKVLDLQGMIPDLGPVHVTLNPDIPSLGEIEETTNDTPGTLDIPPFTPKGTADSFFDIFFTIEVAGQTFHTIQPKHMSSVINHKPPAPGDWYEGRQEIPLVNDFGFPSGFFLGFTRHQPTTTEACCFDDGVCRDLVRSACLWEGGTPQGPGTACEGDNNNNGIDDACEFDDRCEDCGPGPHWVDQCAAGIDHMPSSALVGLDLDFDLDCRPDRSLRLNGPVRVRRSDPRDDSVHFPGMRALDGHLDVLDTEILSMVLTREGITLTAGAGLAQAGMLRPSYGVIAEQRGDITLADTFFDVFFEVDLGSGVFAYNHQPLRVSSKIDCVPPDARYIHPTGCIPLYDVPPPSPITPRLIANLVTADHSTYPARMIRSNPQDEHSLWRREHNIVRIWFDDDIAMPAPGDLLIREMLPGGAFGPDLSSQFSFTVENDGGGHPRIMRIWENGYTLIHRHWYSFANLGGWPSAVPFELQYVVQVGDASDDRQVFAFDVNVINTGVPTFAAPDDARRDINGDLRILAFDVSITNGSIPSSTVPKPSGHP